MDENKEHEERRNEFIDAAEKLFKENGIMDTTVAAIVREVNVAKGLFYYYFKSKDDVIDAISSKYNREIKRTVQQALNQSGSFEEQLRDFVEKTMRSFRKLWENLDGQSSRIDLSILSSRTMDEAKGTAREGLAKLLRRGNEMGAIHVENPEDVANAVIGALADAARYTCRKLEDMQTMIEKMIRNL
ncbi:MAG: TetR/AcrR family transcriptional regulator [Bulleidia sp.]